MARLATALGIDRAGVLYNDGLMFCFRTILVSLLICLGSLYSVGPHFEANANQPKFPALINAGSKNASHGQATLPLIINLAERPELMQPPYLRLVLGTPDRARAYAYPSNSFTWTPADGSKTNFVLNRNVDSRTPPAGETRQFVANYKQSLLRTKDVRSRLGKPTRKFFDNRGQPVELYQITPCTTVAVVEPTNTFDVSQIIVCYSGTFLPQVSDQDMEQAASFRLKQINHHLSHGVNERGLSFLQEHVADNPQDIRARLSLGNLLRNKCDINGAIAEYRRALALAQASGDVTMQKQAIAALRPLGLVPDDIPVVRALSFKEAAMKTAPESAPPALTAAQTGSTPH